MPPAFYFNGESLPCWSAQWHLCSLGGFLNDFADEPTKGWDEFIGYRHIWHLQCRIDHVGAVESEDPLIFRVCAQEVLRVMLANHAAIMNRINAGETGDSPPDLVFSQMADGIARMITLCAQDSHAFWTSGTEVDRQSLLERIRRSTLGPSAPDFCEAPHLEQRRSEAIHRSSSQISALNSLAQNGTLPRNLRRIARQIPPIGKGPTI